MRIEIEITGIAPLMLKRFGEAEQQKASSGSSSAMTAADRGTPREQADSRLYRGTDGETLVMPQPNLLRCIVDGGLFHKAGKSKITTQKSSLIYSCLDIEGVEIPIIHKEPWRVDSRPVVNPSTQGRILSHRPMFDDWQLRFIAVLDTDVIGVKLLRAIIDDAGKKIGLGEFRPARKGPFGKFVVTKWTELAEVRIVAQDAA